ncbi:hypothetical protein, partial [Thioalkalivibrio sp.]|uniref:hypothetical protein n=1 Tax=Thioalkalivibrio sp. TaxID=2093813 RepID=UPI003976385E
IKNKKAKAIIAEISEIAGQWKKLEHAGGHARVVGIDRSEGLNEARSSKMDEGSRTGLFKALLPYMDSPYDDPKG